MNSHAIHFVTAVAVLGDCTLKLQFGDATERVINFEPVLRGKVFGPLRDPKLFNQVALDPEVRTIVWPNGADFDPATLHDWPTWAAALAVRAQQWELCAA
jgi:tRNA U34 5-methylaminomethyl-2-thiouridine-forming methyltransferase MnmC